MNTNKNKSDKFIKPILQFAVLCDGIQPSQSGKLSFIGVFSKFLRPNVIPHFSLVLGWKRGKGVYNSKVVFLDPDLNQIFESPDFKFELKHETNSAKNIINIDGMNFNKPGVYWFKILLDNELIMSIPLPVEKGN